ncbi:MAG: hypothetical protein HOP27_05520 [Anaerolineales bacterium]|nr:hypothetical protein [Anaerolineales bacterium]
MRRIHSLLAVQSVVAILVSINRLGTWTLGYMLPNEFLRWVDFNNMLVLPLISLVAFYLLKKTIEYDSPARDGKSHLAINLVFIVGIYLLAASYGDHEVTNYLHVRFCLDDSSSDLCRIVIFNDDEFSHWIFFTGFVMMNAALLFLQTLFPNRDQLAGKDITLLVVNSVFLGAGIFANLGFEEIGLDLYVVALLAILSTYLLWKRGRQPLFIYYVSAYWLGLIGSLIAHIL